MNTYLALHDDPSVVQQLQVSAGSRPVLAGSVPQVIEQLGELEDAGVDEVVIADWNLDDATARTETLERLAAEVFTAFDDVG